MRGTKTSILIVLAFTLSLTACSRSKEATPAKESPAEASAAAAETPAAVVPAKKPETVKTARVETPGLSEQELVEEIQARKLLPGTLIDAAQIEPPTAAELADPALAKMRPEVRHTLVMARKMQQQYPQLVRPPAGQQAKVASPPVSEADVARRMKRKSRGRSR